MRERRLYILVGAFFAIVGGCSPLVIDRSTDAFAANDLTVISNCQTSPGTQFGMASGVDSCHFTVGDTISSSWVLTTAPPKTAQQVTSGTVDVYYKDIHKSYAINGWTTPISFSDLLGVNQWDSTFDEGIVEALVTINWVDNQGIQQITKYRGIAILVVTNQGYDRMPIDSGNQAWGVKCKIQYSTAGRSAMQCK